MPHAFYTGLWKNTIVFILLFCWVIYIFHSYYINKLPRFFYIELVDIHLYVHIGVFIVFLCNFSKENKNGFRIFRFMYRGYIYLHMLI